MTYAPADMIAAAVEWLVAAAAVLFLFNPASSRYFGREPAVAVRPAR